MFVFMPVVISKLPPGNEPNSYCPVIFPFFSPEQANYGTGEKTG
jgi:hypothetical protein